MLNGLDLFSGIGGISIALSDWVRPIAYCEIDPYCQGVLISRMASGLLRTAPIWDDIRSLCGAKFRREVDVIYGGFPCQDISVAGHGKGLAGERSGLFYEFLRLSREINPNFIFMENVPAICARGGLQVIEEIAFLGYDCRWCIIDASAYVDQKRQRWFLLAKSRGLRQQQRPSEGIQPERKAGLNEEPSNYKLSDMESWGAYARSVRKDHGILNRVDRIRALGNAVVPSQAKEAFKILMGL
jgi:DNA (cytosine-5)-methyltransferase 1